MIDVWDLLVLYFICDQFTAFEIK